MTTTKKKHKYLVSYHIKASNKTWAGFHNTYITACRITPTIIEKIKESIRESFDDERAFICIMNIIKMDEIEE